MAFWQYSFWVIPKKKVEEEYGNIPKTISESDFNSIEWFNSYSEKEFLETIDYLSSGFHWCKDVTFFGDLESDCIEIYYENNKPCEVFLRIDLTKNFSLMAKKMMGSIKAGKLIILDEDLRIITDNTYEFSSRIGNICKERNKFFGSEPV